MARGAVLIAGLFAVGVPAATEPLVTTPAYGQLHAWLPLPAFFEDRVVYYNSYDGPDGAPQVNAWSADQSTDLAFAPDGIRGRCLAPPENAQFRLKSPKLSLHRALTISFWWSLGRDAALESAFGLLHVPTQSRGYVSSFVRGKGEWCALERPTAVLQVYYFEGIGNENGLYDGGLLDRGDLKAGTWHNTVLVATAGRTLDLYTDGRSVFRIELRGRPFSEADGFGEAMFGGSTDPHVRLDEIMILDRALQPHEIATYHTAIRQMYEADYPL